METVAIKLPHPRVSPRDVLQYELLSSPFRGEFRPDGRTWDSVIYILVSRQLTQVIAHLQRHYRVSVLGAEDSLSTGTFKKLRNFKSLAP